MFVVVVFLRNLNANLGFCSCDGPYIKCVKWFDRLEPQTHRFFFILHTDVYRVPGKPQWLMLVVFITSHEWEYMHVHGVQHDPPVWNSRPTCWVEAWSKRNELCWNKTNKEVFLPPDQNSNSGRCLQPCQLNKEKELEPSGWQGSVIYKVSAGFSL